MFLKDVYTVYMVTPAFLGGADQSGEWRTPPFKALLRMWWRIVWWNTVRKPTIEQMYFQEGKIFGFSSGGINLKSSVRITLEKWTSGSMDDGQFSRLSFPEVTHPEVNRQVDTALYLAYGPVAYSSEAKRGGLSREKILGDRETNTLTVLYPYDLRDHIKKAISLVSQFGTIGARSRNGWGSIVLSPMDSNEGLLSPAGFYDPNESKEREWLRPYAKDLGDALEQDWCHCIGRDNKGLLLWCTERRNTWIDVFKDLAEAKIQFRTQFHFKGAKKPPHNNGICDRLILAYPVTHHEFRPWKSERSANQIFFKVLPEGGGFRGLVFHLPHRLPAKLANSLDDNTKSNLLRTEIGVWKKVHDRLDEILTRLP